MNAVDRRAALERDDAKARVDAQRVFDRPIVLEAGAGTGKTTTLVARILAWCLGPGWARAREAADGGVGASDERVAAAVLGRVVAITFTEAAAAEMSTRIGRSLLQVECGETPEGLLTQGLALEPEALRERARALRGALDHLVAQTIHAYCRRLLVGHPLDAGLHPRLEIDADQRLQAEVVRRVLEDALSDAYTQPGDADFGALALRGVSPRKIEEELLLLLAEGLTASALEADPLAPERIGELCDRLATRLDALLEAADGRLAQVQGAKVPVQVAESLGRIRDRIRTHPTSPEEFEAFVEWLQEEWDRRWTGRLRDWGRGKFGRGEEKALEERADLLREPAEDLRALLAQLISLDVGLLAAAHRVFLRLLLACEKQLRERGIATFSALLDGARDLLCERPGVAARLRARIDMLLVDEFQDTDRRQCDIVRALALEGPEEERPRLFVVGDPKQSIYGWRNADLAAYDSFVEEVRRSDGVRLRLSVNYRSAPEILDEVERAIEPVMQERRGVQPGFQPLAPHAGNPTAFGADRLAPVEYWVSAAWDAREAGPRKTLAAGAAQIEATALARDLRCVHDEHDVAWSSIGVLFRSRADWEVYLRSLREANIPFAVEGDRHYYKRREIVDAAALVRCVLDPNDSVALVSMLRSAVVGVPDAAWIPLWARDFPGLLSRLDGRDPEPLAKLRVLVAEAARELPDDVPGLERVAGWERSLCAALEVLAHLRACSVGDPADVFVERLRRSLLLEAGEAARYAGVWRVANLDRFFRNLAEDLDSDGADAVLRRLRRALADEVEEEQGRPVEIVEDAVRILTVHGAKGLDFEHVYLMQLHKGSSTLDEARVGRLEGEVAYRLLTAPTLDWDRFRRAREEVEEAERVRLLYVAMTRAKRRLVLAGLWPELQTHKRSGQALALLEDRGSPDLAVEMTRLAAAGTEPFVDAAGARWVFPDLGPGSEPDSAPSARADVELPSAEEIASTSDALHVARRRAEAHSARPLGGAASSVAHEETLEQRAEHGYGAARARSIAGAEPSAWSGEDRVARVVGTAIHRVLEGFDLVADPTAEIERSRTALQTDLDRQAPGAARERARREALALFEELSQGSLLERLRTLAGHVVARELPVLAGPEADAGPVGFVSGAVDLVYRDPGSDELVIVDYKTDRVSDEDALASRNASYARQGAAYQRALRDALALPYTPRFELWYLRLDRIEQVSLP